MSQYTVYTTKIKNKINKMKKKYEDNARLFDK